MVWSTSNRKAELPPDWEAIRTRVLDRDGGRCQWRRTRGICGSPANQVDHWKDRDDHSDDALWSLCEWHHRQKTQQESAEARRALLAKAKHPVERPPGLL